MKTSEFISSEKFQRLPDFIRNSPVFSSISEIKKIFPDIGLSNNLEKTSVDLGDNKYHIGFSSDGIDGLWDIATMSMRGVCSCMHWDNHNSRSLIGSIVDPFLGIIYLTDKSNTEYGVSFKYRSLVRFVRDIKYHENYLFIERVYFDSGNTHPYSYKNKITRDSAWEVQKIFVSYLSKKTNLKYKIHMNFGTEAPRDLFIPRFQALKELYNQFHSMSDALLTYSQVNDPFIEKYSK